MIMAHVYFSREFVSYLQEISRTQAVLQWHVQTLTSASNVLGTEKKRLPRKPCPHLARKVHRCRTITSHLHRESLPQPERQSAYNISFIANSCPINARFNLYQFFDFLLDHVFIGEISAVVLDRGGTLHRSDECMCIPESGKAVVCRISIFFSTCSGVLNHLRNSLTKDQKTGMCLIKTFDGRHAGRAIALYLVPSCCCSQML